MVGDRVGIAGLDRLAVPMGQRRIAGASAISGQRIAIARRCNDSVDRACGRGSVAVGVLAAGRYRIDRRALFSLSRAISVAAASWAPIGPSIGGARRDGSLSILGAH